MARGKKHDPKVIAAAVAEAQRTGDWATAAKKFGIPRSTLYARRRKLEAAEVATTLAKPVETPARRGGQTSDSSDTTDEAGSKSEPADEELLEALETADDFIALDGLVAILKTRLAGLPRDSPRMASLSNTLLAAITRRAKFRPPPPPDPELEAEAKRLADGDIRLAIERYVEEWEHDAKLRGVCLWCEVPRSEGTHISLAEIAPLVQAAMRWAAKLDDGRATPEDRALWLALEQAPAALKEAS